VGVTSNYSCGNLDRNGAKKYVVCDKPENDWHELYKEHSEEKNHLKKKKTSSLLDFISFLVLVVSSLIT
jgi:hypothetical protein